MAQEIQVIYNILAATTTTIVNAAPSGLTSFTLATTVVGPNQQRLFLTVTGNESSNSFVIKGTNQAGLPITDTVKGPNASTTGSNLDFVTVTSVTSTAATAGTTSLGLQSIGSTLWYIMNQNATPSNISCSGVVTSASTTVTWGVQYTYDDPNNLPAGVAFPQAFNHPTLNSITGTTTADGFINDPVMAVRFLISAGTGVIRGTFIQAGAASP